MKRGALLILLLLAFSLVLWRVVPALLKYTNPNTLNKENQAAHQQASMKASTAHYKFLGRSREDIIKMLGQPTVRNPAKAKGSEKWMYPSAPGTDTTVTLFVTAAGRVRGVTYDGLTIFGD